MTTPPIVSPTSGPNRAVVLAVVALVVGCIAVVWLRSCESSAPNIPPVTQKKIAVLDATKPAFDSTQAAGRQAVARDTTAAVSHQSAAAKTGTGAVHAGARADSLAKIARNLSTGSGFVHSPANKTDTGEQSRRFVADSLLAAARASDSAATAWHAAYDARTIEAQQWRLAAAQSDSAYQAEREATRSALLLYAADTARRVASERVNAELVTAIGKLQAPCRIIGPIPCPSRTVSAAAGVAVTLGTAIIVRSLTAKP